MRLALLSILFCFSTISLLSQDIDEKIEKEILRDFAGIKGNAAYNLIPFQDRDSGKYGYIGAVSKKIIVQTKYEFLTLFNPKMSGNLKNNFITLLVENNAVVFAKREKAQFGIWSDPRAYKRKKDMESGFTVSAEDSSEIESFSGIYNNVRNLFCYNGKLYAIAEKIENDTINRSAIIDEEGNTAFDIDFSKYKYIALNHFAKANDGPYFLAVDNEDQAFFLNLEGKKKLVSSDNGTVLFKRGYAELVQKLRIKFGYLPYASRILDFTKMEWLPEITNGSNILFIDYTSKQSFDAYADRLENHPDVKLYVLVKDDKYPYPYYIGWDDYPYIP